MTDRSSEWVSFTSGSLTAAVDPLGAQLSVLRDADGADLLWNGDPAFWTGRAPLLFPIVGELAGGSYRLGATSYQLARHGFARRSRFQLIDATATGAVFKLRFDDASLRVYPFRFELEVQFVLLGSTLSITTSIRNRGDEEMPASFGYHPAFCWPLPYGRPRAAHFIEFAHDEPAPVRSLDANGLLTPDRRATPILQRRLALADSLFDNDALILDEVRSASVMYGADEGPRIRVSYSGSPYLGIWSKPGADFICIEPWHGLADPQGYDGDFTAKPGVFKVAAGAALQIEVAITLLPV